MKNLSSKAILVFAGLVSTAVSNLSTLPLQLQFAELEGSVASPKMHVSLEI